MADHTLIEASFDRLLRERDLLEDERDAALLDAEECRKAIVQLIVALAIPSRRLTATSQRAITAGRRLL